ncbi:Glyoxalase domain-containing protein RDO1 [Vanrija pseudolonga]|uniref:Glyoxalase domain-containing protein RDO1 n=1 Tax=Vanrija pseudolonga TaxID=143232 RepID=A0AAF0YBZ8_9TREE|nr:Glyoxalase domain-containing protein RDO1 [Vanrija pseudolonga]
MILTPFQYALTASNICTAQALDHTVLVVNSLPRTIAFYARLGMRYVAASTPAATHALEFGASRIELREYDPLSPLGPRNGAAEPPDIELEPPSAVFARPGAAAVCVVVAEPVAEVKARLERTGIRVLCDGRVVRRVGAAGELCSIYVRDPDGNVVE